MDVTGLVDLHSEPNLDAVTVSTSEGSVTAVVDPATGVFSAAAVPLDPGTAPADTQTITATATELPWEKLNKITERIIQIKDVNRCLFDLTPKPPATIEYI